MSIEDVFGAYQRLRVQADAFAALGARLASDDESTDPAVLAALDDVLVALGLPAAGSLADDQRSMLADMIRSSFRQSLATLDVATGVAGWAHTDVAVLDGQGRASSNLAPHLAAVVGDTRVERILDVGTGVGFLAIALARQFPDAEIVGIDIWEPALDRARRHAADAGVDDRVVFRHENVTALDEIDAYDAAWLPAPFLPADVLERAIERSIAAVRPSGLMIVGVQREPADPLAAATQRLRNIADTGAVHTVESVRSACRLAGLDAEVLRPETPIPIAFVGGTVPSGTPN